MDRIQLESLSIGELRAMAADAGLNTQRKASIIAALASDYRNGAAPATATPEPSPQAPAPAPAPDGSIVWPQVPPATSSINGEYVEPPWLLELTAAATMGHVELQGPAGSGKTLAVHHLAASLGKRLAVVTADGGLRKRDLVGQRELVGGQTIMMAAEFAAAARAGDWALIDEANMSEPDALAFLNGMTDRPGQAGSSFQVGGQTIEVHPGFRCFLTRNPGYVGTRSMNEALRDRFWSIEVPPLSGDSLAAMLSAHAVPEAYIPDCVWLVDTLYKAWESNRISYQVSPRRALAASQMAEATNIATDNGIRYWLERSILSKVDAKHDRDSLETTIETAWRAMDYAS
jgi:nitric oxide reductase NorQ protein